VLVMNAIELRARGIGILKRGSTHTADHRPPLRVPRSRPLSIRFFFFLRKRLTRQPPLKLCEGPFLAAQAGPGSAAPPRRERPPSRDISSATWSTQGAGWRRRAAPSRAANAGPCGPFLDAFGGRRRPAAAGPGSTPCRSRPSPIAEVPVARLDAEGSLRPRPPRPGLHPQACPPTVADGHGQPRCGPTEGRPSRSSATRQGGQRARIARRWRPCRRRKGVGGRRPRRTLAQFVAGGHDHGVGRPFMMALCLWVAGAVGGRASAKARGGRRRCLSRTFGAACGLPAARQPARHPAGDPHAADGRPGSTGWRQADCRHRPARPGAAPPPSAMVVDPGLAPMASRHVDEQCGPRAWPVDARAARAAGVAHPRGRGQPPPGARHHADGYGGGRPGG